MLGGTHLGPSELPTDISVFQTNVRTTLTLVVLLIVRCLSATTLGSFEKMIYYLQDLEITQQTRGHTARSGEERVHTWAGECYYWGQRWECRVSRPQLKSSVIKSTGIFKTKGHKGPPGRERAGSLSGPKIGNMFIQHRSLKWIPL